MFDRNKFGQTLNALRKERGYSIQMLAELCDLSTETIRSYLYTRQTPSSKMLLQLCAIFSVTLNQLLQGMYFTPTELEDVAEIDSFHQRKNDNAEQAFNTVLEYMAASIPKLEKAEFGMRLRVFREEAGLSIAELAEYSKIKSNTLVTMESNQGLPGVDVMLRLCQKLCVSPDFLMFKNGNTLFLSGKWYQQLTPKQIKCLAMLTRYL